MTDHDFLDFLADRLVEERAAAARRGRPVRGMDLVDQLIDDLERGRVPDQMSVDLLVVAYADHPSFRPEWNRWREAARVA